MKLRKLAVMVAAAGLSASAFATNGYFSHGYGMKAKGMGGAATATASDAFGGANNPASMVWVGDRLDLGLDLFAPNRSIARENSGNGIGGSANSGSNLFYIPELGFNKMLGSDMSLGVTVYGNGGMNTDYDGGQITGAGGVGTCNNFLGQTPWVGQATSMNLLCGNGKLGVDLMQVIIAPTFAMKVSPNHSLGISPLIGHQQFKAVGLQGFGGYTAPGSGAANLTNLGRDKSNGYGVRIGWMGKLSEQVTMGAAYASRMRMSKFSKYKDLFAEQGDFDIPENWNIGLSFKPNDQWTIATDYQRINYGDVKSIANLSSFGGASIAGTLGCDTCRGFGWQSVSVVKLGVEYKYNSDLTLRTGVNHSNNPIQAGDVTFNYLAPGVVQTHYTLGFTYNVSRDSELTMAYMHAMKSTVKGASLFDTWLGAGGGGTDKIEMYQDSLGVSYSLKF